MMVHISTVAVNATLVYIIYMYHLVVTETLLTGVSRIVPCSHLLMVQAPQADLPMLLLALLLLLLLLLLSPDPSLRKPAPSRAGPGSTL